jgi:hypothetical protein
MALAQLVPDADILVLPGSYSETVELIESHVQHLRLVLAKSSPSEIASRVDRFRVLLLDSSAPAAALEPILRGATPRLDFVVFDTTCFSGGSGRIRRVLSWAHRWKIPIVLVRSHTKLDSLGLEYGRLGSALFLNREKHPSSQVQLKDLAKGMRKAVRLFGGAALPAHFPPYVGTTAYRELTNKRVAAILHNSRRTSNYFASALAGSLAELHFAHGLYVTLTPKRMLDECQTKQIAADLCGDLGRRGLPLRHAGSFGFDFGAAEWFHDKTGNRNLVRIAIPDMPTSLWDAVVQAVAQWWSVHERHQLRRFAVRPGYNAF